MAIYARHEGEWYSVGEGGSGGELPGLGGWATIESVTGNPTRYTYNDGMDWVAFEWTADGSVTTTDGLIETLVVGAGGYGGGAGGTHTQAGGGVVLHTIQKGGVGQIRPAAKPGSSGETAKNGATSYLELDIPLSATGGFNKGSTSSPEPSFDGYEIPITGVSVWYGGNSASSKTGPGHGGRSRPTFKEAQGGIVIVRVPAANDKTGGTGSIPASVRAAVDEAVDQAKEAVRDRRKRR